MYQAARNSEAFLMIQGLPCNREIKKKDKNMLSALRSISAFEIAVVESAHSYFKWFSYFNFFFYIIALE